MKFTAKDPYFEKRVRDSFAQQKFMAHIGAQLHSVESGCCEIHLPYSANLTQQNAFFHAGIVGTLADNAAGYAAFSLMAPTSSILTVEFKLNLLSPADGDLLIARSSVLKYGKTRTICRSDVFVVKDGEEKLCAASQSTLMELRERKDS